MTKLCGNCELSRSGKKPCRIFGNSVGPSQRACVHWQQAGQKLHGYGKPEHPFLLRRKHR